MDEYVAKNIRLISEKNADAFKNLTTNHKAFMIACIIEKNIVDFTLKVPDFKTIIDAKEIIR